MKVIPGLPLSIRVKRRMVPCDRALLKGALFLFKITKEKDKLTRYKKKREYHINEKDKM